MQVRSFRFLIAVLGLTSVACCTGWKYYISYCIFLLFEIAFVYFLFPETSNRSLEELAFRKFPFVHDFDIIANGFS